MSAKEFRRMIEAFCQQWCIPEYSDYFYARYWPAFSQLDEAGQHAFWQVLGVQEERGDEHILLPG